MTFYAHPDECPDCAGAGWKCDRCKGTGKIPVPDDYDSEEARQARRNAYYDKLCACGHALGNHSPITGECMLCDHGHGSPDS